MQLVVKILAGLMLLAFVSRYMPSHLRKKRNGTSVPIKTVRLPHAHQHEKRNLFSPDQGTIEHVLYALKYASQAARPKKPAAVTLRLLWRLNNPFTNGSIELQDAYQRELTRQFGAVRRTGWPLVARRAAIAIVPLLKTTVDVSGRRHISCNLREVARDVTLAATLYALFGLEDISPAMITFLGSEIHRLAEGKKHYDKGADGRGPENLPPDLLRSAARVIEASREAVSPVKDSSRLLRELICSVSGTKEDYNPINLIKPAFESPWRGTFYTLLSLLQGRPASVEHVNALLACQPHQEPTPIALAVAFESLRLYPPIRRVRRDVIPKVDIEAIQRDSRYWGPTAGEWDPSRFLDEKGQFNSSRASAISGWLPFGAGKMKCPAANGYGVRMLIVLVSEILRQIFVENPEWTIEGPEWYECDKSGGTLRPGRDEYGSVWLTAHQ